MRCYLKLVLEGDFPGSPDTLTCQITEQYYDTLLKNLFMNKPPGWTQSDVDPALRGIIDQYNFLKSAEEV